MRRHRRRRRLRASPTPPPLLLRRPPPPGQQPAPPQTIPPRFQGNPVSLDFQGADLRSVLRTFAEISGLNIVIDPSITGVVDVSLRDVPWDQALDIILKSNKLGYVVDGTVVRIAPIAVLASEEEERRKLSEAQALAGELRVPTMPLSYAKAPELVGILTRSALSSRGEVQVDTRTNTLIVRDLGDRPHDGRRAGAFARPAAAAGRNRSAHRADHRDFAKALGVEWGVNGRLDPALGNTTNLALNREPQRSNRRRAGPHAGQHGPIAASTSACRRQAARWASPWARSTARSTRRRPVGARVERPRPPARRRGCRRRTTSKRR